MFGVYLNFSGNTVEAARYYAKVFDAPEPEMMTPASVPPEDRAQMGEVPDDFVVHANVATFAGNLRMSDAYPGAQVKPGDMVNITLSHSDHQRLRQVFERLARDGVVEMPLGPAFFSPLFGSLKDKYGLTWLIMADEQA